jgi:hypothetical protein
MDTPLPVEVLDHRRKLSICAPLGNFAEFACPDSTLELVLNRGIRGFSHSARQRSFKDRTPILNRRSLEDVIPRPGHRPARAHLRFSDLTLPVHPRLGDNSICLMHMLRGQFPVPPQHFFP